MPDNRSMDTFKNRTSRPLATAAGITLLAATLTGCVVTPESVQELKRLSDEQMYGNPETQQTDPAAAPAAQPEAGNEPMVVAVQDGEEWGFAPQGTVDEVEAFSSGSWDGNLVGLVVDIARLNGTSATSHTGFTFALVGDDGELYDPGTAAEAVGYNDYYTLSFPNKGDVVKDATVLVQIPEDVSPAGWVLLDDAGVTVQQFDL